MDVVRPLLVLSVSTLIAACSSSPATVTGATGSGASAGSSTGARMSASSASGAGAGGATTSAASTSSSSGSGGPVTCGSSGDAGATDTLASNRDRLLCSYLAFLKAYAITPQSNGLSAGNVNSVCDVWSKLDPSSQNVFLTLTARMQGSILGDDGSSMLSHIVELYRVSGGQGATATDPGSCGGGEYNRMIMSMDAHLQAAQLAANTHQGALQPNSKYDISDIPATSYWRNSHDLGGPHAPFDLSDETNQGAPRGQTQYFSDPGSKLANSPLMRMDLMTLIDPYAIEMDQDYDCVHNSNPLCTYVTYGPLCAPEASEPGTAVYTMSYGSFDPGWVPTGC